MPVRMFLFSPAEIASILQQHIGIPGTCEMYPTLVTTPVSVMTEGATLKGFNTVFNGVRLVIEEVILPSEKTLSKLVG